MSELTTKEQMQREQAALKHGAYAYQERGEAALKPQARGMLAELSEKAQDRDGVVGMLSENTVKGVMMAELLISYIADQKQKGMPLDEIPAVRYCQHISTRHRDRYKSLIAILPDDKGVITAEMVMQSLTQGGEDGGAQ